MKYWKKSWFLLITIGLVFSVVGCKKSEAPVEDVDKTILYQEYLKTEGYFNNLLNGDLIKEQYQGIFYLSSQVFQEIETKLKEITTLLNDENLTKTQLIQAVKEIRQLQVKIISNKKEGKQLPFYPSKIEELRSLFNYPYDLLANEAGYHNFYLNYTQSQIEAYLKTNQETADLVNLQQKISDLINYMKKDALGEATFDESKDFCLMKNPFKSCLPKFISLPDPLTLRVANKTEPLEILSLVKAVDARGEDISSRVYFVQALDYFEIDNNFVQIAVSDNFGNELIAPAVYQISVTAHAVAPTIKVRQESEITGLGKAKLTDLRTHVDAYDYLMTKLNLEQIKILSLADERGLEIEPSINYELKNAPIPKNLVNSLDFTTLDELELTNDRKYYNAILKEVTLPTINENQIEWEIVPNDYLKLSEKIVDGKSLKAILCLKLPESEQLITLTARHETLEKQFELHLVPLLKEPIYVVDKPGTYQISYQAEDLHGNFSKIVRKELIVLPPSQINQTALIETTAINPEVTTFELKDLDNFGTLLQNLDLNYTQRGTIPLQERVIGNSSNAFSKNEKAQIILFDEAIQTIDGVNKLDGFHQMTQDLAPYIDGFVPLDLGNNIALPNQDLINLFHQKGVRVYGYLNIPYAYEGGSLNDLMKLVEVDENGDYRHINTLVMLAKSLGFDGWAISIKTGLYDYIANTSTLSQVKLANYLNEQKAAKKEMEERIIPFLTKFYEALKLANLKSIYELGISSDGALKNASFYTKEHEALSRGADLVVTNHYDKKVVPLDDEINDFISSGKEKEALCKGLWTPYADDSRNTLDDFLKYLDSDTKELKVSLALYNLSWRLFNLKTKDLNYGKLDPKSPLNLVSANDYHAYLKRINHLIAHGDHHLDTVAVLEDIISNNPELAKNINYSDYFSLARLVPLKTTIKGNQFYTNFNPGNGFYYFENGEKIADFTNRKTWNSDGGINFLEIQNELPHFRDEITFIDVNGVNKLKTTFDFNDGFNGFNSYLLSGAIRALDTQRIRLFKTYLTTDGMSNPILKLSLKTNDLNTQIKVIYTYIDDLAAPNWYQLEQEVLITLDAANQYETKEISLALPAEAKAITSISLEIGTTNPDLSAISVHLGELYFGEKIKASTPQTLKNANFLEVGFKYQVKADAKLTFDPVQTNEIVTYKVYQLNDGKRYFLSLSHENFIFLENLKRFATNPVDPNWPTLEEYDQEMEILIIAEIFGEEIANTKYRYAWPNELIPGGKAKVKISSTIAKPGEPIIFTPLLSPMSESYEFNFYEAELGNAVKVQKLSSDQVAVVWLRPGFYSFTYTTKNPYGTDRLDYIQGIIISEDVPSESDLTPDAKIDDSEAMADIKYSKDYANAGERPSYLIDDGPNGGPNLATKWCATNKSPGQRWVIIDFQEPVTISRFVLSHCQTSKSNGFDMGAGDDYNTREYEIYASEDGVNWTKIVHRENNFKAVTEDILDVPVRAKHLKLVVVNGGCDITARIYDMRIFGTR